ncbi:MAG: class I SAM-dependent methyltransferase [Candidatus Cloacimonetes bacterium]|nr:class I SAM-dependent methyltransferase [Candidatus Cloacimonadota bacterium]
MEKLKQAHIAELKRFAQQRAAMRRLWNIDEPTALLLYHLTAAQKPEHILEVGTSNGYSTFWLSLAAETCNATVETIEVEASRFALARENLAQRTNIIQYQALAEEQIPRLRHRYDLVFIDAGKICYISYIKLLMDKLNHGALIIADNVISHQSTVQDYLDFVRGHPQFESMKLNIDAGLEISRFKKE